MIIALDYGVTLYTDWVDTWEYKTIFSCLKYGRFPWIATFALIMISSQEARRTLLVLWRTTLLICWIQGGFCDSGMWVVGCGFNSIFEII